MPIEPDDLIAAVADADLLAEAVEDHLDVTPLPVDEDAVDRAATRLSERIAERSAPPRRSLGWVVVPLVAAAAAAVWVARFGLPTTGLATTSDVSDAPAAVLQAGQERVPETEPILGPSEGLGGRPIVVEGDTTLLTSSAEGVGVLLVQEGEARVDDATVPAGHWAVVPHPEAEVVVFPDGEAPPVELDPPVRRQLEDVRWRSLPPRTHDALERLLEDR